jgi:(p)ppGpp synthase/HD superfamily hydrolase
MNLIQAKNYFFDLHDITVNQKYNKILPYSFHLGMVEAKAIKFQNLIPVDEPHFSNIFISVYGHDSIEDARLTYNDIKTTFNENVAEIIYLCTEDKGRNRAERKSENWYQQLNKNNDAVFVKLCDIIANVEFSLLTGSSMFEKYKSEYSQKVKPFLYRNEFRQMFDHLDKLFSL